MSWLFGILADHVSNPLVERITKIHPTPLYSHQNESYYIAFGGIRETCLVGTIERSDAVPYVGWGIVGLGIDITESSSRFLSSDDWQTILMQQRPNFAPLNGHFIAVRWGSKQVDIFSDQVGVRTAFVARMHDGIVFSSRLDWISQFCGGRDINFAVFGSQWISFCGLTYESPLQDIQRLGPGGVISIQSEAITSARTLWAPSQSSASNADMCKTMYALLRPAMENHTTLSLGLSGGLDSRFMISQAMGSERWVAHVFGESAEPDVQLAHLIAQTEGFVLNHYLRTLPNTADLIKQLQEYAAQTSALTTASLYLKHQHYRLMCDRNLVMVDGAFGELGRRQLFNRLFRHGLSALQKGEPETIARLLRRHRASIFNTDVLKVMNDAHREAIVQFWQTMPDPQQFGFENFVDLFTIRTQLANSASAPQAWMDAQVRNYMAFVQPSFLNAVFGTRLSERRNGRLYRDAIRRASPRLSKIPLVKEGEKYPFGFATVPALVLRKMKRTLGFSYRDDTAHVFLKQLSEFVNDLVRSEQVRTYAPYDHRKILKMVDAYYHGDTSRASEVDWWLSFELWRRGLQKPM